MTGVIYIRRLSCQGRFGCYSFFRILVLFPSRRACRHLVLNCETFSIRLLLFLVQEVFCSSSLRPSCTIKFLPQIFLRLFETSGFTFQLFSQPAARQDWKKIRHFYQKNCIGVIFFFILLSLFSDKKKDFVRKISEKFELCWKKRNVANLISVLLEFDGQLLS